MALEEEARDAILTEIKNEAPKASHIGLRYLAEAFALATGNVAAPVDTSALAERVAEAVKRRG